MKKTLNLERQQSVQSLYLNLLEETENMRFYKINYPSFRNIVHVT
jgi:hypothetical protein